MLLYRLMVVLARLALGIFFRRIEVEGKERVPLGRPLVFVANHPNTLIDVLVVGTFHPKKIHFLAKGALFENRIAARFFSTFGVIPVYRRQDAADMSRNVDSFERCYEALEKGGSIAIFPEGTSVTEPRLLEFKTGAARIALGAEERNGFALGVHLVPVALAYDEKATFRSRVLVRVGEPADARTWAAAHAADPQEAARSLTASLKEAFAALLPQADDWRELRSIDRVRRLYRDELRRRGADDTVVLSGDLAAKVRLTQAFLDGYVYYKEKDPAAVRALRRRVDRFYDLLDHTGVPAGALALESSALAAAWFLVRHVLVLLAGFPVYLVGLVHNYPPYLANRLVVRALAPETEYESTYKLLAGILLFVPFHAAAAALYGWFLHPAAIPVSLFLTVASGLFTLAYWNEARHLAIGIGVFFRFRGRIREGLERRRREILEEVERLAAAYPGQA
ncbi:MAG: 1-acyl-sn-glycerol-3-phosphate acyltransferase [Planctomycetes bacterium]|nr:1-acyl-sn-glycerol-3-phosphate acyltransferase [Planctomycetota bacterium]